MNRSSLITLLAMLAIVLAVGVYVWSESRDKDNDGFADSIPKDSIERIWTSASYTNLDGEPIDLTDYRGRVLVVNSWASWCPFCVNELPDLATVAAEYEDRNVTVLAINRSESPLQVHAYLNTIGDLDGVIVVLDEADAYYSFIGGFAMPETVFYDSDGNVVKHKRGYMAIDEMRRLIDETLAADEAGS